LVVGLMGGLVGCVGAEVGWVGARFVWWLVSCWEGELVGFCSIGWLVVWLV
jgi:hypothetical protein